MRKKRSSLEWEKAPEIKKEVERLLKVIELPHIDVSRIFFYRSQGSTSRSYARIWSFPKIFQDALELRPAYVIEILSRHFDKLGEEDKKKVLIHELLHIPKNFSGALLPHRSHGRHLEKQVQELFKEYKKKLQ